MSDLTDRLRNPGDGLRWNDGDNILSEAADEIDKLLMLRDDYKADLLAMQRERDALRADAARYRWLRDPYNQDCHSVGKCAPDAATYDAIDWLYGDALDESIDAALKGEA